MEWDKCSNPNCPVSYEHSSIVEECLSPNCGNKRPRCEKCKRTFVDHPYNICKHCLADGVKCDSCGKSKPSLYKTEDGTFWCFSCLPNYADLDLVRINPDTIKHDLDYLKSLNKKYGVPEIDTKKKKEEQLRRIKDYRNSTKYTVSDDLLYELSEKHRIPDSSPTETIYTCMGCNKKYVTDDPEVGNFCEDCLVLMRERCCVECMLPIDSETGIDETGKCVNCGNDFEKNYNESYDKKYICPNCDENLLEEGDVLCEDCLRKIDPVWT